MALISKTIQAYIEEAIADWRASIAEASEAELVFLRERGDDVARMARQELERRSVADELEEGGA